MLISIIVSSAVYKWLHQLEIDWAWSGALGERRHHSSSNKFFIIFTSHTIHLLTSILSTRGDQSSNWQSITEGKFMPNISSKWKYLNSAQSLKASLQTQFFIKSLKILCYKKCSFRADIRLDLSIFVKFSITMKISFHGWLQSTGCWLDVAWHSRKFEACHGWKT